MSFLEELAQGPRQDSLQQVAVSIIQRAWRRYLCRAVFEYLKVLIVRCNDLDPRRVLRDVNPREAELLDAAAGVFVRFRLGGISFPPGIYYKIFTYRPIVDLCAGSLRDCEEDRSGWYQRTENNYWRLFSNKAAHMNEPADDVPNRRINFHFSRLKQRQEVDRWRKRRKIQWMKKMYETGRLQADSEHTDMVERSVREVMDAIKEEEEDKILEWEVDELLAWTNTLNFEEYMEEWKLLACSQTSEQRPTFQSCLFLENY